MCVIERLTTVDDSGGGQTDTWADLATVACRVAPSGLRSVEQPVAGRSGLVQFYVIHTESPAASGVALTEEDRIRHAASGQRFEVTARQIRSRELNQSVEAVLVK